MNNISTKPLSTTTWPHVINGKAEISFEHKFNSTYLQYCINFMNL